MSDIKLKKPLKCKKCKGKSITSLYESWSAGTLNYEMFGASVRNHNGSPSHKIEPVKVELFCHTCGAFRILKGVRKISDLDETHFTEV